MVNKQIIELLGRKFEVSADLRDYGTRYALVDLDGVLTIVSFRTNEQARIVTANTPGIKLKNGTLYYVTDGCGLNDLYLGTKV